MSQTLSSSSSQNLFQASFLVSTFFMLRSRPVCELIAERERNNATNPTRLTYSFRPQPTPAIQYVNAFVLLPHARTMTARQCLMSTHYFPVPTIKGVAHD